LRKKERKTDVDAEYLDMMVYNFKYAIEYNYPSVYMGYSIIDDDYLKEYWVKKSDWLKTLDILIECAIDEEEYEYCNEFKKIKELI